MAPAKITRANSNRTGKYRSSGDDYAAITSVHLHYAYPTSGMAAGQGPTGDSAMHTETPVACASNVYRKEAPTNDVRVADAPQNFVTESRPVDHAPIAPSNADEAARLDVLAKRRAFIQALARQTAQEMAQALALVPVKG